MSVNNTPRHVVSMIRVSTPEQVKDGRKGLARQREDIAFFCQVHNLTVDQEFPIVISGKDVQRTRDFNAMLGMLKRPDIAGIVVAQTDRLLRADRLSVFAVFSILEETHKPLFCELGELDLSGSANHRMMFSIQAQMGGIEHKSIAKRTHDSIELLRERVDSNGYAECKLGYLPQGIEFVPCDPKVNRGTFRYTPFAYQSVLKAFEDFAAGKSLPSIVRECEFNGESAFNSVPRLRATLQNKWWLGYVTRLWKKIDQVWNLDTEKWTKGRIVPHDKPLETATNLVEAPLVSVELFNRVQLLLAVRHRTWTKKTSRFDEFLLSDIAYCECGSRMYPRRYRGQQNYYICADRFSRPSGRPRCTRPCFRADCADEQASLQAMLYLTDEPFLADTIKGRMSTDQTDDSKDKLKLANRQIDKATAIVLRAAKARRQADNEIERREAMKQLKAWNVKLKRGKEAALVADAEIPHAGIDAASVARQFRRDFTDFARLPIGRRKALFAHYVERCILVRRPTNEVPPEIQVQFILKADVPPVDSPEGTPRQSKPSRLVMVSHLRAATLPRSGSQR